MKFIERIRRIGKKNLLKMDERQLCDVIMSDDKPRINSAVKILLKIKNGEEVSLITIMKHLPFLRKRAWKRLLKKKPSETNLHYIKREIPSMKKEVDEALSERYPEKEKEGYQNKSK